MEPLVAESVSQVLAFFSVDYFHYSRLPFSARCMFEFFMKHTQNSSFSESSSSYSISTLQPHPSILFDEP
jgi:hypothetical protein